MGVPTRVVPALSTYGVCVWIYIYMCVCWIHAQGFRGRVLGLGISATKKKKLLAGERKLSLPGSALIFHSVPRHWTNIPSRILPFEKDQGRRGERGGSGDLMAQLVPQVDAGQINMLQDLGLLHLSFTLSETRPASVCACVRQVEKAQKN